MNHTLSFFILKYVNDNLEQQVQEIFKSWFIEFSKSNSLDLIPSKFGSLPRNFMVTKINDLPIFITDYVANGSFASLKENVTLHQEPNFAYFIRNTDLKSGTFGVFVDEYSYKFLSKSALYGGEIIISNVGDVGSVFLSPKLDKPMTLGNNIIMLKPIDDIYQYYIYILFKWFYGQDLIQAIKGGSAQPKFNKTDFKSLEIMLPPKSLLKEFQNVVAPIFTTIQNNSTEATKLIELRDTLLVKLMSGELALSADCL